MQSIPQYNARCNVASTLCQYLVFSRNDRVISTGSPILRFQMEITGNQDENITAETHDSNYACKYWTMLSSTLVNVTKKRKQMHDIRVNDIV
jgi:hypothetical protein